MRTAVRMKKRMTQKKERKRILMKRRKCACQAWMEKRRLAGLLTPDFSF